MRRRSSADFGFRLNRGSDIVGGLHASLDALEQAPELPGGAAAAVDPAPQRRRGGHPRDGLRGAGRIPAGLPRPGPRRAHARVHVRRRAAGPPVDQVHEHRRERDRRAPRVGEDGGGHRGRAAADPTHRPGRRRAAQRHDRRCRAARCASSRTAASTATPRSSRATTSSPSPQRSTTAAASSRARASTSRAPRIRPRRSSPTPRSSRPLCATAPSRPTCRSGSRPSAAAARAS